MSPSTSTFADSSPLLPRRRRSFRSFFASASALAVVATLGMTAVGWTATAQASPAPTWQRQVTPGPAGAGFQGISCTSAGNCVAVGGVSVGSHSTALAETETSGTWAVDSVPQPSNTDTTFLSVSCASPTTCVAVGTTNPSGHTRPFTEVLNATTWTIVTTAKLVGISGAELDSVSCAEANACRAVGAWWPASGNNGTLVEVYNGSKWTLDKTLALAGSASFNGVSCLPATVPALCTAVGAITVGTRTKPLVEHANGNNWTTVAVPTVTSSNDTSLDSISCPQPTSCVTVGSALEGSTFHTVSEVENLLHWTMVATPAAPIAHTSDDLFGVSCPLSIDSCRAVGFYGTAGTLTLAEGWNGHRWAIQTSATPPSDLAELLGVSCVTINTDGVACTAAGEYQDAPTGPTHTLAERN